MHIHTQIDVYTYTHGYVMGLLLDHDVLGFHLKRIQPSKYLPRDTIRSGVGLRVLSLFL